MALSRAEIIDWKNGNMSYVLVVLLGHYFLRAQFRKILYLKAGEVLALLSRAVWRLVEVCLKMTAFLWVTCSIFAVSYNT